MTLRLNQLIDMSTFHWHTFVSPLENSYTKYKNAVKVLKILLKCTYNCYDMDAAKEKETEKNDVPQPPTVV